MFVMIKRVSCKLTKTQNKTNKNMEHTFAYIGKLHRDIDLGQIVELIKQNISKQQSQFNTGLGDDNPEKIEIVDYAYVEAEPNCYMVNAKWKIKK